jgi:hypothetical protein
MPERAPDEIGDVRERVHKWRGAGSGPASTQVVDRSRNWFAVAALWTLGATWLGTIAVAIAVVHYADVLDNDVSENVGWALLGVGTVGFVLTLAAFTAARTRGELTLAWAALALALGFVALGGGPILFYGLSGE